MDRPHDQDDLTGVVLNLAPAGARGSYDDRMRDPNQEPLVRLLLEAGLRAVHTAMLTRDSERADRVGPSVLHYLSIATQSDVIREFLALASESEASRASASRSVINRLWPSMPRFHADLVRYTFRPAIHAPRMRVIEESLPELVAMPLSDLIDMLATSESSEVQDEPAMRLQCALLVAFPKDRLIREGAHRVYVSQRSAWARIYAKIGRAYGLDPAGELNYVDLAAMMNVVVEGVWMRRLASPALGLVTDNHGLDVRTIETIVSGVLLRPWVELAPLVGDPTKLRESLL